MSEKLSTLKRGKVGFLVERLQTQLMHWGILTKEDIDGDFGPVTEAAVKKFQQMRPKEQCQYSSTALEPTGIVDKNTWCELLRLKPDQVEMVEKIEYITKVQVEAVCGKPIHYDALDDLNNCLQRFKITTPVRIRHFMAQIAHESGGLQWFKELSSGWQYEGRDDLGNTRSGDGPKYKGGGVLQLTGRYNYQKFAEFIGDQRVMEGVNYVASVYPFTSAGFWWHNNKINDFIAQGATCRQVSAKVNGRDPANGLADRLNYYSKACSCIS
jgi:putative chitinase